MKKLFYHMARIMQPIALHRLVKLSGHHAIFPFYHLVSDEDVIHIRHLYRIRTVKEFEKDIEFYLRNFPVLAMDDLKTPEGWRAKEKKGFLLSFDDGLREFHDVIAPILLRKGIPAICFINSAFIDNKGLFYRYKASLIIEQLSKTLSAGMQDKINLWMKKNTPGIRDPVHFILSLTFAEKHLLDELAGILEIDFDAYLKMVQPYLTSEQIKALAGKGFVFGGHGVDHAPYSELPVEEQILQTSVSIEKVCSMLNQDYKLFSFPFTDHGVSSRFFREVLGPRADLTFGCAGLKTDSYPAHIQRIPVEEGSFSASEIIYGEYVYYLVKALLNKNRIIRK